MSIFDFYFFFFSYSALKSCRLRVHRNLVAALILHSFLLILLTLPQVLGMASMSPSASAPFTTGVSSSSSSPPPLVGGLVLADWACKLVIVLKLYSALASINWMFIEGLLLHSRITVSIFRKTAPFRMYHFIGWCMCRLLLLPTLTFTHTEKRENLILWVVLPKPTKCIWTSFTRLCAIRPPSLSLFVWSAHFVV